MKYSVLKKSPDTLTFEISGVDEVYANTLRRLMMTEVPVMAIEDVEFKSNSSILYDEMIAHRLGLTVLKTDLKSYNLPEECKCRGAGCAQCTLKLTLKAKGPGIVKASQLKSKDPKVVPVYPDTPIVKLLEGQTVELIATAVLGIGKTHAKFSPCHCFHKHTPYIKLSKQPKNAQEIADMCPKKCFKVTSGKLAVNPKTEKDCIWCAQCVDLSSKAIHIDKKDDYILEVEAFGQLTPKEIGVEAIKRFDGMLAEVEKLIKAL